jgi:hypothetical protein
MQIHFELYGPSTAGAAESAILVNFGGPGGGRTTNRDLGPLAIYAPTTVLEIRLGDGDGTFAPNNANCVVQIGNFGCIVIIMNSHRTFLEGDP